MSRLNRLVLATTCSLLGVGVEVSGAPPQVTTVSPFGARKGTPTELTFRGSNLGGGARLLAPFSFQTVAPAPSGSDDKAWKTTLTVDPATAIGVYPVRLQTDEGLSAPFLLAVGQLPQVQEVEENSTFETAQVFQAPAVVEGQAAGNDVDFFRFKGKKGETILVDAQCARIGSGVDPTIRLTTGARAYVGSADDTPGLLTDARLFATLPEDGDYVVEISDSRYQGGAKPVYRLVIGALPAPEEVFPIGGRGGETLGLEFRGGTLGVGPLFAGANLKAIPGLDSGPLRLTSAMLGREGSVFEVESLSVLSVGTAPEVREPAEANGVAPRVAAPVFLNGRIDPPGDEDRFTLAVTPGQKLRIEVEASEHGSALDGVLQILDGKGAVLATADDTTVPAPGKPVNPANTIVSPDPVLDFTVPAGQTEVTLALRDLEQRGGLGYAYRISVEPVIAGFDISLNDAEVNVPKGGTSAVAVTVVRKGYNGPIALKILDPPAGLTVRPGTIAEGQLVGAFSVSAAPDAGFPAASLQVVGEAQGPTGPISRVATKALVFASQANLPTNRAVQYGLPVAPATNAQIALDANADPIEIAHGQTVPVTIKAVRGKDKEGEGTLALTAAPLPPGLTAAPAKLDDKAAEVAVNLSAAPEAALGKVSMVLVGKGTIGKRPTTIAAPALTLEVVRPAAVELAVPALEVKAGGSGTLKGKVVRRGGFREAVVVKVTGLPAGLKCDPVTVAADASEFSLAISAEEKAAAATANASVTPTLSVDKKNYPSPAATLALRVLPAAPK